MANSVYIGAFIFTIITSIVTVIDTTISKEQFPDPIRDPTLCGASQHERSFVCDPDSLLSDAEETSLNEIIKKIENSTKCTCRKCLPKQLGYRVGVAVVKNVPRESGRGLGYSMIIYGDYIRKKWNLGKCDDDVLVLLSIGDKKIYSSFGVRTKKVFDSDTLRDIYNEQGDDLYTYKGLKNVLGSFLKGFHESQDPTKKNMPYIIGGAVGGGILLILIIACIISRHRRNKKHTPKKNFSSYRSEDMKRRIAEYDNRGESNYKPCSLEEPDYNTSKV